MGTCFCRNDIIFGKERRQLRLKVEWHPAGVNTYNGAHVSLFDESVHHAVCTARHPPRLFAPTVPLLGMGRLQPRWTRQSRVDRCTSPLPGIRARATGSCRCVACLSPHVSTKHSPTEDRAFVLCGSQTIVPSSVV